MQGLKSEHGAESPDLPPHFDHWYMQVKVGVVKSCDIDANRFEVGGKKSGTLFFRVPAVLRTTMTNFAPPPDPLRVTGSMLYHVESYLSLVVKFDCCFISCHIDVFWVLKIRGRFLQLRDHMFDHNNMPH